MVMKRFLMKLSYDGNNFCGWQIQPQVRTVQLSLETALSQIAKQKIAVVGSGRTDTGVHALAQYAHFDFPINMQPQQISAALNSKLTDDILVKDIQAVSSKFHARYDARKRSYKFIIAKQLTPFNRLYQSYFPRKTIILDRIQKATPYFLGKHDFTSFCKFNPDLKHQICEIYSFNCKEDENAIILELSANRFLHNMVRRIVGTLVNVSHHQIEASIIKDLLKAKSPANKLISTAPPQGLYLQEVKYPELN